MLESLKHQIIRITRPQQGDAAKPGPGSSKLRIVEEATRDIPDVLDTLKTTPDGLSSIEAETRRAVQGLNEIAHDKPPGWDVQLFHSLNNPSNGPLIMCAA